MFNNVDAAAGIRPHFRDFSFRIVDVDVRVDAPPPILKIVEESYRRFPPCAASSQTAVAISIQQSGDAFNVLVEGHVELTLDVSSGRGALAIGIANAIITAVADRSRFVIFHAASLERNGRVLSLAAPAGTGKTLLTAHLLSRGWRIITDEYSFVEPTSGSIAPFPKLAFLRWTSLPWLPRSFRRAVERSSWFNVGHSGGIVFTGVDPSDSYGEQVWSNGGRLTHMLIVSNERSGNASIGDCDAWAVLSEINSLVWPSGNLLNALSRLVNSLRGVRVGRLTASTPLKTVDEIERWFSQSWQDVSGRQTRKTLDTRVSTGTTA